MHLIHYYFGTLKSQTIMKFYNVKNYNKKVVFYYLLNKNYNLLVVFLIYKVIYLFCKWINAYYLTKDSVFNFNHGLCCQDSGFILVGFLKRFLSSDLHIQSLFSKRINYIF